MEDKWINIPRGLTPVLTPVSWHIRSGQEEESDLHTFSSPPHLLLHLPRLKIVLPGLSRHLRPDRGGSDQYVLWWLYLLEVTWLLWKCWLLKCQIRSDAVTWLLWTADTINQVHPSHNYQKEGCFSHENILFINIIAIAVNAVNGKGFIATGK